MKSKRIPSDELIRALSGPLGLDGRNIKSITIKAQVGFFVKVEVEEHMSSDEPSIMLVELAEAIQGVGFEHGRG